MKIYHDLDQVTAITNAVVTTGSFDGVHLGHKVIIGRINRLAQEHDGESVLITFHPHPRKVLYPETAGKHLKLINSQQEKIELLRNTGLDNLIVVPFTQEFSRISSFDFIRKILVAKLHVKTVVIGFNHHFGHKQEGDLEVLEQLGKFHGFGVEEIPEQDIENESVSSTRVRQAIEEGKIQRANAYLDHYYLMMGVLDPMPGFVPSTPSFTIRVEEECKLMPPHGFYACSYMSATGKQKSLVMIRKCYQPGLTGVHEKEAILFPVSDDSLSPGMITSVFFHKLLAITDDASDSHPSADTIVSLVHSVEDLIY